MICQVCHKEFNNNLVHKFYGQDHLVTRMNLCSVKCYEERNNKRNMYATIYGGSQNIKDSKEYLETIEQILKED